MVHAGRGDEVGGRKAGGFCERVCVDLENVFGKLKSDSAFPTIVFKIPFFRHLLNFNVRILENECFWTKNDCGQLNFDCRKAFNDCGILMNKGRIPFISMPDVEIECPKDNLDCFGHFVNKLALTNDFRDLILAANHANQIERQNYG